MASWTTRRTRPFDRRPCRRAARCALRSSSTELVWCAELTRSERASPGHSYQNCRAWRRREARVPSPLPSAHDSAPVRDGSMMAASRRCNYNSYMRSLELKVARIGNSRGVRLPAATLERYGIGESVMMEERSDGILLRPHGSSSQKLSWEETAREMAAAGEDWSEWDAAAGDGISNTPWEVPRPKRVAEKKPARKPRRA